jgi:hypothetical protein
VLVRYQNNLTVKTAAIVQLMNAPKNDKRLGEQTFENHLNKVQYVGAVPWCPFYPYIPCPKDGYSKSESHKWGLFFCQDKYDQCKRVQSQYVYNIRAPVV